MILYVNGCSHTAAAEAAVDAAFAVDDGQNGIDRRPHPANLAVSWCTKLAQHLGIEMYCAAESASSNDRMIRTTRDWINFVSLFWYKLIVRLSLRLYHLARTYCCRCTNVSSTQSTHSYCSGKI